MNFVSVKLPGRCFVRRPLVCCQKFTAQNVQLEIIFHNIGHYHVRKLSTHENTPTRTNVLLDTMLLRSAGATRKRAWECEETLFVVMYDLSPRIVHGSCNHHRKGLWADIHADCACCKYFELEVTWNKKCWNDVHHTQTTLHASLRY